MKINVVITGRSYHQANDVPESLDLPPGSSLDQALAEIDALLGGELPGTCLLSVSGNHVGNVAQHENVPLNDGDELVLIAPVAGG